MYYNKQVHKISVDSRRLPEIKVRSRDPFEPVKKMARDFVKKEGNEKTDLQRDVRAQGEPVAGVPNSLVMRIMEEPDAEQEADRLSRGVTSRTPDALRQEMGGRLGADLSSVRFHSDSASVNKSRAMGARAWA